MDTAVFIAYQILLTSCTPHDATADKLNYWYSRPHCGVTDSRTEVATRWHSCLALRHREEHTTFSTQILPTWKSHQCDTRVWLQDFWLRGN